MPLGYVGLNKNLQNLKVISRTWSDPRRSMVFLQNNGVRLCWSSKERKDLKEELAAWVALGGVCGIVQTDPVGKIARCSG